MDAERGPTVRRRQLGRALKDLREKAGKKLDETARFAGLTSATISRIENGKQAILPRNVRLFCQYYEVGAPMVDMLVRMAEESSEVSWYSLYSDVVPNWAATLFDLERDADEIRTYESELVPGLLQTTDTTKALTQAALWTSTKEDLDRSAELRRGRQKQMMSARPPRLRVVINEAVVRRPVGGWATASQQMFHLAECSQQGNVEIRILPFTAGAHPAMTGAFTILRFPDELDMNAVFLEHDHGATTAERPADLRRYSEIFERIWDASLTSEETTCLLASLGEEYNSRASERGQEDDPHPSSEHHVAEVQL